MQARITRSGRFGGRITIGLHLNELVTHDWVKNSGKITIKTHTISEQFSIVSFYPRIVRIMKCM